MNAKDILEISTKYVQDEEKELVFERLLLPLIKRYAECGDRKLTLNNFSNDEYSFKDERKKYGLKHSGDSLASYCRNNLQQLLISKGFSCGASSPFYVFNISW